MRKKKKRIFSLGRIYRIRGKMRLKTVAATSVADYEIRPCKIPYNDYL